MRQLAVLAILGNPKRVAAGHHGELREIVDRRR
jgi:hypothetical protein